MPNPWNRKVAELGHIVMRIKLCCQVRCFYASVCETKMSACLFICLTNKWKHGRGSAQMLFNSTEGFIYNSHEMCPFFRLNVLCSLIQ